MWFFHADFMRMVCDSWNAPLVGSPTFIFPQKLKRLKVEMKLWNQMVFSNVHVKLKQTQLRFEGSMRETDDDPFNIEKQNHMKDAQVEVNDICMQLVKILKRKSRNKWLMEVASNTSFFHYKIRMRRSNNTISELVNDSGDTVTDYDQIRDMVVNYYQAKFNGDNSVLEISLFDIERDRIYAEESTFMDRLPTVEEIHEAVFDLGADSAPGPDGFAAIRLGSVLGNLVSEEQVAFMKGRNIHENICLASEMVNEIHIKRKEGNVGLKLDITQAFDTVSWSFILAVFKEYGFSDTWCSWILQILRSARISVLVNGSPEGNMKSLRNLVALLGTYQRASGQTVSREKRKIYYGGSSLRRRANITEFLGMNIVSFPDRYLGVKVMPGVVKYHHISNAVEKIKEQLAGWKGRMLSFQDRVVLVKSVIASYSIHNIVVYKWPRKFIHQCEAAIRNFLWSGDSLVSRSFMVAYDKICAPYNEGGLGISRMRVMNKVILMKLCWNICNSNKAWVRFMRAKFFGRNGQLVGYMKSSILPGFKWVHSEVQSNYRMLIGDGRSTSLYFDAWCVEGCIVDAIGHENMDGNLLVSDFIHDGAWVFTDIVRLNLLETGVDLNNLPNPMGGADYRVWKPDYKGNFSVRYAKELVRSRQPALEGKKLLWRPSVHPTLAARNWKILRGACATLDKDWISDVFGILPHHILTTSYKAAKGTSRIVKDLWLLAILVIRSELWMTRNGFVYDNQRVSLIFFQKKVFNQIQEYSIRLKGCMFNSQDDLRILSFFRVRHRQVKHFDPIKCFWEPPQNNEMILCCDGVARGNPGRAGAGVVVRDANANVVGAMSVGFGVQTNYLAELFCVIVGLEWAVKFEVGSICIRTDSMSVVLVFSGDDVIVPWFLRTRWMAMKVRYNSIRFIHSYREATLRLIVWPKGVSC
ncbi:uncharacterized protein LOC113360451 [Papaver somniferum]|uniref:uncharacterized protein LOC113360451 n=1 Tax=Papaver somniferum TaxID=3469 RepID=UPI000E6FAF71|nr:uncharacterized protein LOC113360451 [Papaver somniferum]